MATLGKKGKLRDADRFVSCYTYKNKRIYLFIIVQLRSYHVTQFSFGIMVLKSHLRQSMLCEQINLI